MRRGTGEDERSRGNPRLGGAEAGHRRGRRRRARGGGAEPGSGGLARARHAHRERPRARRGRRLLSRRPDSAAPPGGTSLRLLRQPVARRCPRASFRTSRSRRRCRTRASCTSPTTPAWRAPLAATSDRRDLLREHARTAYQGEPFLKLGLPDAPPQRPALTGGRFEVREGLETVPGDATLLALKRTRIAERLGRPVRLHARDAQLRRHPVRLGRPGVNLTAFGSQADGGRLRDQRQPRDR